MSDNNSSRIEQEECFWNKHVVDLSNQSQDMDQNIQSLPVQLDEVDEISTHNESNAHPLRASQMEEIPSQLTRKKENSSAINHNDHQEEGIQNRNRLIEELNENHQDISCLNELDSSYQKLLQKGGLFESESIINLYKLVQSSQCSRSDPFYVEMRKLCHEYNNSEEKELDFNDGFVSIGQYHDWRLFLLQKSLSMDPMASTNNLLLDFKRDKELSFIGTTTQSESDKSDAKYDTTPDSMIDDISLQNTRDTNRDDFSETDSSTSIYTPKYLDPNTVQEAYSFVGIHHLFEDKGQILRLKFANFEKGRVAWATSRGHLIIAQLDCEEPQKIFTLTGHTKPVLDFDWSMTNDYIVSVSQDKTMRIWDTQIGKCIRIVQTSDAMGCCLFHPINNNRILCSSSTGNQLIWYNTSTGLPQKKFIIKNTVSTICFTPQGNFLLIGDNRGCLYIYIHDESSLNMKRRSVTSVNTSKSPITSISFSSYERFAKRPSNLVLVNDSTNHVKLFGLDLETCKVTFKAQFPIMHSRWRIRSIFCPLISMRMGAVFVTGCESSIVKVFDLTKGSSSKNFLNQLSAHTAPVLDVSWNYNETILGSCDAKGTILFWKREKLDNST